MAALINGPRDLPAFLLIVFLVLPSLHSVNWSMESSQGENSCIPPTVTNGRVKLRERGLIAKFQCRPGNILWGAKYATCIHGVWDQKPPICVRPGCRPLTPLIKGTIMVRYQGAVAILLCNQGYYLKTMTKNVYGRQVVHLRESNYGIGFIYCDGRTWNATGYQCLPMPPTAKPSTTSTTVTTPTAYFVTTNVPDLNTTTPEIYSTATTNQDGDNTPWVASRDVGGVSTEGITFDTRSKTTLSAVTTLLPRSPTTTPATHPQTTPPRPTTTPSPQTSRSRLPPFNTPPRPANTLSPRPSINSSPRSTTTSPPSTTPSTTTPSPRSTRTSSPRPFTTPSPRSTTSPSPRTTTTSSPRSTTVHSPRSTTVHSPRSTTSPSPRSTTSPSPRTATSRSRLSSVLIPSRPPITPNPSTIPRNESGLSSMWCDFSDKPASTSGWKRRTSGRLERVGSESAAIDPMCGWEQPPTSISHPGVVKWQLVNGINYLSPVSSRRPDGNILKAENKRYGLNSTQNRATLMSPAFTKVVPAGTSACFSFLYKVINGSLQVMLHSNGTSSKIGSNVYRGFWYPAKMMFKPRGGDFRLAMEASGTTPWSVEVDNLLLGNSSLCESKLIGTTGVASITPRWFFPTTASSHRPVSQPNASLSTGHVWRTSSSGTPKQVGTTPRTTSRTPEPSARPFEATDLGAGATTVAEPATTGVPRAAIWSSVAAAVLLLLLVVTVVIRRLASRRKAKQREGGDGDSDVRYLTSDEEHLDFSLQRAVCEDM